MKVIKQPRHFLMALSGVVTHFFFFFVLKCLPFTLELTRVACASGWREE